MSLVVDDDTDDDGCEEDGCEEDGDGREKIIRKGRKYKMGSIVRMEYG